MTTSATVKMLRRPLAVSLSALLLLLLLGTPAVAQDDDWGLPSTFTTNNTGPGSDRPDDGDDESDQDQSELLVLDLLVYAELVPGTDDRVATVTIDKHQAMPTDLVVTETPGQAEVVAEDVNQPVGMTSLDDGVRLQGGLDITLNDAMSARLSAPVIAAANMGVLIVDDGSTSLTEVLDAAANGNLPPAVTGYVLVGELPAIDLRAFAELAAAAEGALGGTHLTVLIATLDDDGALHLGAARTAMADKETVEVAMR